MNDKKINLIPNELVIPAKTKALKAFVSKLTLFLSVVLFASLLIFVGLYFYFSTQLKVVNADIANLKSDVATLEQSEQRLVIIKDRLAKIAKAKLVPSAHQNVVNFQAIEEGFRTDPTIEIKDFNITSKKIEVTFKTVTTQSLLIAFDQVKKIDGLYNNVTLVNFAFNPIKGYTTTLVFTN